MSGRIHRLLTMLLGREHPHPWLSVRPRRETFYPRVHEHLGTVYAAGERDGYRVRVGRITDRDGVKHFLDLEWAYASGDPDDCTLLVRLAPEDVEEVTTLFREAVRFVGTNHQESRHWHRGPGRCP